MARNRHILPIAAIMAVIAAISVVVALTIDWLPDPAGKEADRVDLLVWWTVWASIGIFSTVMAFTIYSIWKFRVSEDDQSDGPPIHGHTLLEVVWTAIPTVMIGITAAWGAVVLIKNEDIANASGGPLRVDVLAQQFAWEFTYPELGVTTGDLRVPVDRQVVLTLRAQDVIHSFYVQETRIKGDAVPGIENDRVRFTLKPEYAGRTYPIICTELCGAGHGVMRAQLHVMSQADYASWERTAQAAASEAPAGASGTQTTTTGTTP